MKNHIFAIAISMLAFSGAAFGADLPIDEVWSQELSAGSRFLGDPWLSDNGNVSCFLANADGLVLIDDGEVVWEGPLPEGQLASGACIDFGIDGPHLLVAVVRDSIGQILEYSGEEFHQLTVHSPAFLRYESGEDSMSGHFSDTRYVNFIIPVVRSEPDSSRSVILTWISSGSAYDNFWGSSQSWSGGGAAVYSLASNTIIANLGVGHCQDFQIVDIEGEGRPTYLFGVKSYSESHGRAGDFYEAPGAVIAVNNRWEQVSQLEVGGWQDVFFRLFPDGAGQDHKIVGVGCHNNVAGPGGYPYTYWSNWPVATPEARVDSMWYSRVVDFESPEENRKYALLFQDNRVLVFSIEDWQIAGLLALDRSPLDARSVKSANGARDEIVFLYADRISLARIGSLSAPDRPIEAPPTTLSLSCFPSPFNSSTTISFATGAINRAPTALRVYDTQGRLVTELLNSRLAAGEHKVVWNAAGLSSGVYLVRLETEGRVAARKVVLMR